MIGSEPAAADVATDKSPCLGLVVCSGPTVATAAENDGIEVFAHVVVTSPGTGVHSFTQRAQQDSALTKISDGASYLYDKIGPGESR